MKQRLSGLVNLSFLVSLAFHGLIVLIFCMSYKRVDQKKLLSVELKLESAFSRQSLRKEPREKLEGSQSAKAEKKKPRPAKEALKVDKELELVSNRAQEYDRASAAKGEETLGEIYNGEHAVAQKTTRDLPELQNGDSVFVAYPEEARFLRIEGSVRLLLVVSKSGKVVKSEVLSGPEHGLQKAALKLAKKLRFLPATDQNGNPQESNIEHVVEFRLHKSQSASL